MVRVVETPSSFIVIDKKNDKVTKIFSPYWIKKYPWLIENEVRALSRLNNKHFPKLISHDENSIVMEYAGETITQLKGVTKNPHNKWDQREFGDIPDNFEEQVEEILDELKKANLRHSDINYVHFLVKDGVVKLIDFETCIEYGEALPRNYMKTMGLHAKTRNVGEEVDDKAMAHRTIKFFKNGLKDIQKEIDKLPKGLQYHELPFEFKQKTDRKFLKERVEIFESVYDFKGKEGIDLGCNIGGITFSLAMKEAKMTGLDNGKHFLNIANACEKHYNLGAEFIEADLTDYCLNNKKHYDFCIFVATWHWIVKRGGIKKATEVLKKISEDCDVMFLETNFGPEPDLVGSEEVMTEAGLTSADKLVEFIKKNTEYTKVENVGKCIGWGNRITWFCSK